MCYIRNSINENRKLFFLAILEISVAYGIQLLATKNILKQTESKKNKVVDILQCCGSGIRDFLTPGSGMGENEDPDPRSGMNIPDHNSES
jgi:hypothetical protein